jgi:hypothetical protein
LDLVPPGKSGAARRAKTTRRIPATGLGYRSATWTARRSTTAIPVVYDLGGGVTEFSDFRVQSNDETLPLENKYDFTFGLGGGLGFGISPTSDVYVTEMSDLVLHPSSGTSTTAPRMFTFRAGFRVGF